MHSSRLSTLGFLVLPLYFCITVAIGYASRRRGESANSLLNASRSLPLWIVVASFLAANCGALEVVGLSAMAAQYGPFAFHFYWIGAIPAMIFLSLWMLPVYMRSGIRSIPEYLALRYGEGVRLVNACTLALAMLLLAGISLYAMAQVLEVVLGFSFLSGALLSAAVVLVYVLLGGVRATIYAEVFQLLVMVAGLLPLAVRSFPLLRQGGSSPLPTRHLWQGMPLVAPHAPADVSGLVLGLGFVLSFGYWCTDFVLMQRALASRTEAEARQVPLWAGFGKLAFSLIVVVPGLAAARVLPALGHTQRFDQTLPLMMTLFYGPTFLGLGLTALAASLMSGLAANISGFAAIVTQDIYRSWLVEGRDEMHYVRVGRLCTVAAALTSVGASFGSFLFSNLMEHVQLIFSLLTAPFWAVFLLGTTSRRATARGALWGLVTGTGCAALHHIAVARQLLHYGSRMSANFYGALCGFTGALAVGWCLRAGTAPRNSAEGRGLWFDWKAGWQGERRGLLLALSALLLATCVALNLAWW